MTDYLDNEVNNGDIVLYNRKGSKGYRSSFAEGVVIRAGGNVIIIEKSKLGRYKEALEYYKEWKRYPYFADQKHISNVVNLTALGARERVELDD